MVAHENGVFGDLRTGKTHMVAHLIRPPDGPLGDAIPESVRKKWRKKPTLELRWRLRILSATGPVPCEYGNIGRCLCDRAQRAAWETYLHSAYACGLMESSRGKDILGFQPGNRCGRGGSWWYLLEERRAFAESAKECGFSISGLVVGVGMSSLTDHFAHISKMVLRVALAV